MSAEYYEHRALEVKLNRALAKRERANRAIAKISGELRQARDAAAERLGLTGVQSNRLTPVVLDLIRNIEVDGTCWLWHGARNNKGLPRCRDFRPDSPSGAERPERSACVMLDIAINDSDGTGIRYPNCRSGRDCVNPAHKRIRGDGRQFQGVGAFDGGDAYREQQAS